MIGSRRGSAGDLIVIGGGVTGLSAAWSAARLGFSVTCIEAREVGHHQASSAGWAKIYRYAYQQRRFAEMLADTEHRWHDLEARSGRRLITRCEGLNIGRTGSAYTAAIADSLKAVNRRYEILDPGSPRLIGLGIRLRPDEEAVLELDAGVLVPEAVLSALSQQLRQAGGRLIEGVTVREIIPRSAGIRVRTDATWLDADRVIVAIGPWIRELVPNLPVPLIVTAQQQLMVTSERPIGDGRQFSWAEVRDDDGYGFVNLTSRQHVIGSHGLGPSSDPLTPVGPMPGPALREQITAFRSRLASEVKLKELRVRTCLYTNAKNEDFVISSSDHLPGVILLSACSGHGFKFALTTGHQAAELACD